MSEVYDCTTPEGLAAVRRISPGHAAFALRLLDELGEDQFALTVEVLGRLSEALDAVAPDG